MNTVLGFPLGKMNGLASGIPGEGKSSCSGQGEATGGLDKLASIHGK
jgi:hypothetical protein